MKLRLLIAIISILMTGSCASVPPETVTLSQTLGKDIKELHKAHRNMVQLYYGKIKDNINIFIDEVYAPYIINYMLNSENERFKSGKPSLYQSIEEGRKLATPEATEDAITYLQDFLDVVNTQIDKKRKEILSPVQNQETGLLNKINESYENALLANASITNYLVSIRKLKETQQEVVSMVGLKGADTAIINTLMTVSENINDAVNLGKKIDIGSDKAFEDIENITNKIKELTNNNE